MPSIRPVFGERNLEISYSASAAIVAGQVVERTAGVRKVGPAGAASTAVCGVACNDVPTSRSHVGGPQVSDADNNVTVARQCVINVTYAAPAVAGDKLVAAAAGQVTPVGAAANTDARQIIGECFDDTAGAAVGKALIY